MMRLFSLLVLPLCLAGCGAAERDATTEPPIAMKGGVYSVALEGGAFGISMPMEGNQQSKKSLCVRSNEDESWIYKAIREQITKGPECRSEDTKRTGNAISGRVTCTLPRGEGGGTLKIDYNGTISEEAVDLVSKLTPPEQIGTGQMSAEEQQQMRLMAEVMEVHIRIRREGDC